LRYTRAAEFEYDDEAQRHIITELKARYELWSDVADDIAENGDGKSAGNLVSGGGMGQSTQVRAQAGRGIAPAGRGGLVGSQGAAQQATRPIARPTATPGAGGSPGAAPPRPVA
jgi:hypothetical protein